MTRQLVAAGVTLGIEVHDHTILGDGSRYCSLMESGTLALSPTGEGT